MSGDHYYSRGGGQGGSYQGRSNYQGGVQGNYDPNYDPNSYPSYDPNFGFGSDQPQHHLQQQQYHHQQQQYQQEQYHQYYGGQPQYNEYQGQYGAQEGYDNYDDQDFANLDAIDQALAQEEERLQMAELEQVEEINRADLSRVPSGAVPSRNGVLSPRAAEFWFPECRDCVCCQGYKHGCPCCKGGVQQCTRCGAEALPQPPAAYGSLSAVAQSFQPNYYAPSRAAPSKPNTRVPVGVPSQGGVLSKHAAEFWFPECRECSCCSGYKHGCRCCQGGVTACKCSSGSAESASPAPVQEGSLSVGANSFDPSTTSADAPKPNTRVPVGVPSQGGVLSKHAAEFWFPECRECSCCSGYKHGCRCCKGGVTACKCSSGSAESASPAPVQEGALSVGANSFDPSTTSADAPKPNSRVPVGVPSQGGVLSKPAVEICFEECRQCSCCNGYKHRCRCCKGDVTACKCSSGSTESAPPAAVPAPVSAAPPSGRENRIQQVGCLTVEAPEDES